MVNNIHVGIIGAGRWGTNYIRTLSEMGGIKIDYICSLSIEEINAALALAPVKPQPKKTTNHESVFNDSSIDAVIISTPGSTHYTLTKQALLANKHVLVEKPLAFTPQDAKELITLAQERKKVLMIGHLHLYNPAIRTLKEDIDAGLFGNIRYIESMGTGCGPVRHDMSALWDFLPHDISIIMYLLNQKPLNINAYGESYLKKGIEDVVNLDMRFKNKIFSSSFVTWLHPYKQRHVILIGEKRFAVFDDYAKDKLKYFDTESKTESIRQIPNRKPLNEQVLHFLDCIRCGAVPLTGGDEAFDVTRILYAAQKSLQEKKSVNV